jgi:hypothetical protein
MTRTFYFRRVVVATQLTIVEDEEISHLGSYIWISNYPKIRKNCLWRGSSKNCDFENRFVCRVMDAGALQIVKDSYSNAVKSEIIYY